MARTRPGGCNMSDDSISECTSQLWSSPGRVLLMVLAATISARLLLAAGHPQYCLLCRGQHFGHRYCDVDVYTFYCWIFDKWVFKQVILKWLQWLHICVYMPGVAEANDCLDFALIDTSTPSMNIVNCEEVDQCQNGTPQLYDVMTYIVTYYWLLTLLRHKQRKTLLTLGAASNGFGLDTFAHLHSCAQHVSSSCLGKIFPQVKTREYYLFSSLLYPWLQWPL